MKFIKHMMFLGVLALSAKAFGGGLAESLKIDKAELAMQMQPAVNAVTQGAKEMAAPVADTTKKAITEAVKKNWSMVGESISNCGFYVKDAINSWMCGAVLSITKGFEAEFKHWKDHPGGAIVKIAIGTGITSYALYRAYHGIKAYWVGRTQTVTRQTTTTQQTTTTTQQRERGG